MNQAKTRKQAVDFIKGQLSSDYECTRGKAGRVGYGIQELRELMDFIYCGWPQGIDEELFDPERNASSNYKR